MSDVNGVWAILGLQHRSIIPVNTISLNPPFEYDTSTTRGQQQVVIQAHERTTALCEVHGTVGLDIFTELKSHVPATVSVAHHDSLLRLALSTAWGVLGAREARILSFD